MADPQDFFNIVVVDVGRQAHMAAMGDPNPAVTAKIKYIGFGDVGYAIRDVNGNPLDSAKQRTALESERARVELTAGATANDLLSMTSVLPAGTPVFPIREIGLFLDDGTLFAVGSHPTATAGQRNELVPINMSFLYRMDASGTGSLEVVFTGDADTALLLEQISGLEGMLRAFIEDGAGLVWNGSNPALLIDALNAPRDGLALRSRSGPPTPPIEGNLYLADGMAWDPARRGGGPYFVLYSSGAYRLIGESATATAVQTNGVTPRELLRVPVPPSTPLVILMDGTAHDTASKDALSFFMDATLAPTATPAGRVNRSDDRYSVTDAWRITAAMDGTDFVVTVAGAAGKSISWAAQTTINTME